ncbi:caspase family protein [Actinokineospora sp. 24-640]
MKRAPLVGIDRYQNFKELGGCENDARALHPLLARNEDDSPNFHRKSLTGTVTRGLVLADVRALLAEGADLALLYFAGHDVQTDGDIALVTSDTPGLRFGEALELIAN